jgi:WD40 repeat protein
LYLYKSHDGKHIASALGDKTLKLWDESSSAFLRTLDVGTTVNNIPFDTAGIGTIFLGISSASNLVPAATALQDFSIRTIV